jgi:hypothetical protein
VQTNLRLRQHLCHQPNTATSTVRFM